jgi:ferredoxin-NADP reductase
MAIVKKYPAVIVSIQNRIEGVYTLTLESLDKEFKYEPGQFLHLALDEYDPSGQWPDSRCFSIQSAPGEKRIGITYAVKGKFTRRMQQELKPGKQLTLKLPYGNLFSQSHNKTNTVFIAGGTGITPYLSLFTHTSFLEYVNPRIYAGFRDSTYNIYEKELSIVDPDLLKIFYEDVEGVIDINKIYTENGPDSFYFISGPPLMIKLFKQALIEKGVPLIQVLTDDWE